MKPMDTIRNALGLKPKQFSIELGREKQFPFRREWITGAQLNHHVHIVGASGFGKTVLISHIIRELIQSGRGVLFIDQKGDRETIEQFTKYVHESNRLADLKVFSLSPHDQSATYNLLANGSATQLRDRIMMSLNWSEEYYKNQAASFLLRLLTGLCWLRDNRTCALDIKTVHSCSLNIKTLESYVTEIPVDAGTPRLLIEEARLFLKSADNFQSLQGLRSQLESLTYSDFGDRIVESPDSLNLFERVQSGKIAFVFLDTRRFGETAKSVGRFFIQDLKAISARIDSEVEGNDRKPFTVIIDEFADLAQEDFIGFLDRARSSRIGIVLAHQEISDLDRISPQFCGRLMGNTSTLFAFLQKRPESAELICGIAGTRRTKVVTHQFESKLFVRLPTGMQSEKEVDEFIIHPNTVKSLGVGECVYIRKYPKAATRQLTVKLP